MKNEREKSDPSKVAKRPANKPKVSEVDLWGGWAESAEPREGAEGNTGEQHTCRTPSRESVSQGLERVREACKATLRRQIPKVGARCVNHARRDLCGGCSAMSIPTAIAQL